MQFARGSRLGLGQGGGSRSGASGTRGTRHSQTQDKENPQDYMSKAKQLWNYVGKVWLSSILFTVSANNMCQPFGFARQIMCGIHCCEMSI